MNKKILILYTSVGLGHKYIALNIGTYLEKAGYEVKLYDVLQLQKGLLTEWGEWLHNLINRRFPFIWRWLYLNKTFTDLTLAFRVPVARRNNVRVKQVIEEFKPDLIISTETMPSAIVASLKQVGNFQGKFVIAFSDYHLHRYWLYDEADLYLANISDQVEQMKQLGVKQPVVVCGITLPPLTEINPEVVKQKLRVPPNKKIILLSSGSMGIGFPSQLLKQFIYQLTAHRSDLHIIVVCGKNETLKRDLEKEHFPDTTVLGFYQPMSELYEITDLFLTKPGGLSTAEALQAGAPLQITHWLPGQEELNYNYLIREKLVYPMPDVLTAKSLAQSAVQYLDTPKTSDSPAKAVITQKNHEGEVLLNTIEKLFHTV